MRRRIFEFPHVRQIGDDLVHNFSPFFDMGQFTAAKDDGNLHLVFVDEKAAGLFDLEVQVVVPGLRAEADFLEFGVVGRLVGLLLFLVLIFPKVHHPADGRALVGGDFHQVQPHVASPPQGLIDGNNSKLCSIFGNDSNRGNPNLVVDTRLDLVCDRLTLS